MEIYAEDKKIARFLHSAQAIVSLIWITVCALLYYNAPSFQAGQFYDCRWQLAQLAICAAFGHIFLHYSQTELLFAAALISSLYSAVYSTLTLSVYILDTSMLVLHANQNTFEHHFYLKLAAIMIVLAVFGVCLSLGSAHRLLRIAEKWSQIAPKPQSIPQTANGIAVESPNNTFLSAFDVYSISRTMHMSSAFHAASAIVSLYTAVVLFPLRLWYVRAYIIQEVSCALLAIFSVGLLQMTVWRRPTTNNRISTALVKSVLVSNICQLVQEINMAVAAYYALSYISHAGPMLTALNELQQQIGEHHKRNFASSSSFSLLNSEYFFGDKLLLRKVMTGIGLGLHMARFTVCLYIVSLLGRRFFSTSLWLRIKLKIDTELVNVVETLTRLRKDEKKWLLCMTGAASAVAVGHVLLNFSYLLSGLLYETVSIATGLSVTFSVALALSIFVYAIKQLRWAMILSAYFALNLLVTSILLLIAFGQDLLYLTSVWDTSAAELDDSPYFIESKSESSNGSTASNRSGEVIEEDYASLAQQNVSRARLILYFADLILAVLTFAVAIAGLQFSTHRLIASRTLQTQRTGVQRMIRVLHGLGLLGMATVGLEFLLLVELQVGNQHSTQLSMNNSMYDWLLMAALTIFLCYSTKHERSQSLLPVLALQLASVFLTSLDLLAQQTEIVQVYIQSALQYYHITEAILRHGMAMAIASKHQQMASFPTSTPKASLTASPTVGELLMNSSTPATRTFSATRTFTVPVAPFSIPIHMLVDILVLHALQIIQWFMTFAMLAVVLYAYDNLVEDEQDRSNDFHELNEQRNGCNGARIGNNGACRGGAGTDNSTGALNNGGFKANSIKGEAKCRAKGTNGSSFDNRLYLEQQMQDTDEDNIASDKDHGDIGEYKTIKI